MKQLGKENRTFHSMEELERFYFPRSVEAKKMKKITDPTSWGVILARSPISKINILLGNQKTAG